LAGLKRRLKHKDRADLENHLRQLDRLEESLPESHIVRLVVEARRRVRLNERQGE
jgi:hypothetical protein